MTQKLALIAALRARDEGWIQQSLGITPPAASSGQASCEGRLRRLPLEVQVLPVHYGANEEESSAAAEHALTEP